MATLNNNLNVSYGAIWGNVCNRIGLQAEMETLRNLTASTNVCFSITLNNTGATTNLEDGTEFNFFFGVNPKA